MRLYYGRGQQWDRWRTLPELAMGSLMEARIADAYGWLASGYRTGDQVFLFGYSRGAFAVRSLAGMIARLGLLRPDAANEDNVRVAWSYYQKRAPTDVMQTFHDEYSHDSMKIRMIGCFDTVMALGVRLPLLWKLTEPRFRFHDTHLGPEIEHGVQALALDETREAFAPILWQESGAPGRLEQVWFRGAHADVGGQLNGMEFARPLANIPLVWMLGKAEDYGLPLPQGWRGGFICDATAPQIGSWRNWGKAFLLRTPRIAGENPSEALHETVPIPYPGPAVLRGHLAEFALKRARWHIRPGVTRDPRQV